MAGIDDALERLITDTAFRAALRQDPRAALADYDLTDDERQLLTSQLSQEAGASGGVEQRTSKSGLAGALGMFDDAVAAAPRDAGLDSVEVRAHDASTPQADDHKGDIDILDFSWGASQSGTLADEPDGPMDIGPARAGEHEPAPTGDTIPQDHMTLNFEEIKSTADASDAMSTVGDPPEEAVDDDLRREVINGDSTADTGAEGGSGKANVQDLTLTKYTDPAGDPDQPIVVGSLYNAEEPEPSDGTNETQDGLSNTVLVSETTEEPDSHGMGSPYLKQAVFDNTMDPSGDPDDLVADGTDERPSSPTIAQALVNNEVPASDDAHEIEMDVHVGRSEPDDVMTDQDPDAGAKDSPVKAGYDLKINKKV